MFTIGGLKRPTAVSSLPSSGTECSSAKFVKKTYAVAMSCLNKNALAAACLCPTWCPFWL